MMRLLDVKYKAEFEYEDKCQNGDDLPGDGVDEDGLVPFLFEPSHRSYVHEEDDEPRPRQCNAVIKVL